MREIEIIPAVNAATFEEVQRKVKMIEPYVSWVHLDVADGTFTDVVLWHNPHDLWELKTPLFIEVHLMLDRIDERVEEWLEPNVRRVIFHQEASKDPNMVIAACRAADIQAGIAIRPDTPVEAVVPYLSQVDLVQALAVMPGRAGQAFRAETLETVRALRSTCTHLASGPEQIYCRVEVDGGVNASTVPGIVAAGADILTAASAIFSATDIAKAIEELRRHAETT